MTESKATTLREHLAANPGAVIEDAAREYSVTSREVLEAMPAGLVSIGGGETFGDVMNDIATWGDVTLIINTIDAIFEFTGPIPRGEVGHGYFNLMQPKGLHGHLRYTRCGGLAFVERSFRGKASAFIAFLNVDGGIMFKVFVGRDEARELRQDQLGRFHAWRDKLTGKTLRAEAI